MNAIKRFIKFFIDTLALMGMLFIALHVLKGFFLVF